MEIPEKVVVGNKMKIIEILNDGFVMIEYDNKSIIPDLYFLKDKELKEKIRFKEKDIIYISIENVNEIKEDLINKKIVLYAMVNMLSPRGVYTKYYDEEKGQWHREFFYKGKGLLTLPRLRKGNPFEVGDFVKITAK